MEGKLVVPINVDGVTSRNVVINADSAQSLTSRVLDACKEVLGPGRLEVDKRYIYRWITDKETAVRST